MVKKESSCIKFLFLITNTIGLYSLAFCTSTWAATSVPFTINLSEPANVVTTGGTPRIALNVGGITRYATYTSGTGTSTLTFSYDATAGDVDLDGVTLTSPIDLNGGTIRDINGNNSTLTFTIPDTSNVKINFPSLSMDFITDADGRYTLNGTAYNDLSSFLSAAGGTFSRASVGTYFDSSGMIQTASANTPRFDYDPTTHAAKGLLIEESRENLFYNSSTEGTVGATPDDMYYGDDVSPIVSNAQSIDSNGLGVLHTRGSSGDNNIGYKGFAAIAERTYAVTVWCYIPASSTLTDAEFSLENGSYVVDYTGTTTANISLKNQWQKVSFLATVHDTDFFGVVLRTNSSPAGATIYTDAWQIEEGTYPTSYIPTNGSTVTRAADFISMPTGSWFNNSEGNLSIQFTPTGTTTGYPQIALFGDNTLNNFIAYTLFPSNNIIEEWKQSGSTLFIMNAGAASEGTTTSISGTYKTTSSALSKNGAAPVTSSATLSALPVSLFSIGSNLARGTATDVFTGHYRKIKYHPSRPLNAQLLLLSQ